jgi:AAA+ ATPase superfamily predicted ATPase
VAVADQSAPAVQREFLAEAVAGRFPGFDSVVYPGWRSFLTRLTSESERIGWHGPVIFDEFPYLIAADSSLASVFQNWIDHEAATAGLIVAVAGSSQRMMQGLVLDSGAPLYGRSRVQLEMNPLLPGYMQGALKCASAALTVQSYSVWGGIPRYWELAADYGQDMDEAVDRCVLDPLAPLFREPERLLLEESPPAIALRPLLDLVGAGVHRVSKLAGRLGVPSTSLSRPLSRLVELGLIVRETPFGESERTTKRSLYRISDPFFRFWFRVIAPNKAQLTLSPPETRKALWHRYRPGLLAESWEELCRRCVPMLHRGPSNLGRLGPWEPAKRYWRGNDPQWDIVARSVNGERLLLAEAKWWSGVLSETEIMRACHEILRKGTPAVRGAEKMKPVFALFVPEIASREVREPAFCLTDAEAVLSSLRYRPQNHSRRSAS